MTKRLLLALGTALLLACSPQATELVVAPQVEVVETAGSRLASPAPGASGGALYAAPASPSEASARVVAQQVKPPLSLCPDAKPKLHPQPSLRVTETVMVREWTATTRVYRKPNLSRRVMTGVAAINYYNEDFHLWEEPAPTIVESDNPAYECMVEFAPYLAYFSADGSRLVYPDRNDRTKSIAIPAARFVGGRTFTENVLGDNEFIAVAGDLSHELIMRFEPWAVVMDTLYHTEPATNVLLFDYTLTGYTKQEAQALFNRNTQTDADGIEKPVQTVLGDDGVVRVTFDKNAEYPLLVDPTISPTVDASACDASEDDSANNPTITNSIMSLVESDQYIGMCWTVDIPQGATIDEVLLTIWTWSGTFDQPNDSIICAEDVDDAPVFTTTLNELIDRYDNNCTTATDTWNDADVSGGGGAKEVEWGADLVQVAGSGHDLSPLVQEVIDRPGWVTGNRLAMLANAGASGFVSFRTYDFDAATAPVLDIEYTAAAAGGDTDSFFWQRLIS